jgi:hypothetical protein
MSTWDHSGPIKFSITASIGDKTQHYILPARIENVIGTGYKITASTVFGKT